MKVYINLSSATPVPGAFASATLPCFAESNIPATPNKESFLKLLGSK